MSRYKKTGTLAIAVVPVLMFDHLFLLKLFFRFAFF